jgi:hypothetical protein
MPTDVNTILEAVAQELQMPENELVKEGLRTFLERRLRAVKAEIFAIHSQYGVDSVEEMDARYRDGSLEEDASWRDMQRLDHLEYEAGRLEQFLRDLG